MTAKLVISEHNQLGGLAADDHPQYLHLPGRAGGQVAIGGTLTTQTLTLQDNAVDANQFTLGPGISAGLLDGQAGGNDLAARHLGLGVNRLPTNTHMIIGSESYVGTGSVVGYGCFPEYAPSSVATNVVSSIQGNVWFSTVNWGTGSGVRGLDFYPAPLIAGSAFGSANLDITGVNTGGLLNILGRTITANTITGIAVVPITNIFGGTDNTTANVVRGMLVVSAAATNGTWGRLTGIEVQPQTSGVINQGVWLAGDGVGADLCFGAGAAGVADANMYYDGTDFLVNTDLVAPSDLLLDCGTDKTLELVEPVWEDLRIVPGAFTFAGVSDPTLSNWQPGGAGATFKVWKFQEDDEVFFTCQLPHSYKEGTDIKAHLHWTPADRGNEESGNAVDWRLDYSWANQDGTFPSSGTVSLLDTCDGTDDKHQMTPSATISGTGKTISSMLVCRLYRDPTNDTWSSVLAAQSPAILEFDFHFEEDTVGSRQELVK